MLRSILLKLVVFVLVLFLSIPTTQAADWLTYQKDWTHNAIVPEDSIIGDLKFQWSKQSSLGSFQSPLYYSNNLYFLEYSNTTPSTWTAYASSKDTGRELWRTSGSGRLYSNFTVGDNLVLIPGSKLVALDATTGQKVWEAGDSNHTYAQTAIDNNRIYAIGRTISPNSYNGIFALNTTNGSIIWQKSFFGNVSGLSFYRDSVIVTSSSSSGNFTYLDSYDTTTGNRNWYYYRSYNPFGPLVVDESRGLGFTMGTTGMLTQIDLDTGLKAAETKWGSLPTIPLLFDGKACYITSTAPWVSASSDLECYDYVNNTRLPSKRIVNGTRLTQSYTNNPILVGDRIYISTISGELASFKLDGSDYQKTSIVSDSLGSMIYADGTFVILNTLRDTLYAVSAAPQLVIADSHITLTSPYKTDGEYHEYLGQTHSHYVPDVDTWSKIFNGDPTPVFTEELYKNAGYDFIALTEHDEIVPDPGVEGILHIANSEEDTHALTENHILAIGINEPIDELQVAQKRINDIISQEAIALLPHPNSKLYPWSLDDLKGLKDYSGIEILNGSADFWWWIKNWVGNALATDKWDQLLSSEKPEAGRWGAAGDDYTPGDGGFDGAAIVVRAKRLDQTEILQNIKAGNFYAVQGSQAPRISVTNDSSSITVTSNLQGTIKFIGKDGRELKKESDVLASTYTPVGDEIYVRAEVESDGKKAWSQPIEVEDNRQAVSTSAGRYQFDLGQAQLLSNNTGSVQTSTLPSFDYPDQSPPYGYISPIYSFNSNGQVQDGTELTINYADRALLANEDNLSIFTYDAPTSTWAKVTSVVDKVARTVKANLTHFSLYTLSAEMPPDSESPQISLINPIDLTGLAGSVSFVVSANDNNAVFKITTLIDDKLIDSDSNPLDGWSTEVNMNDFVAGNHKLTLVAEDAAGNIGQASYNFSIAGTTFVPPTLDLITPQDNEFLFGTSTLTGSFTSQNPVGSVDVFLDDFFITNADITGSNYQKDIDWSQFVDGDHILKVILTDQKGNQATVERVITLGVKVDITSPEEKAYLHAETVPIEFTSQPEGMIAKIDGNIVSNHTSINAYNLSLGQHLFTIEYDNNIIAQRTFTVSTSIADQINLVEIFWQEGRFKNQGMRDAMIDKLAAAQVSESLGLINQRDQLLSHLINFVIQKSEVKKPLVDSFAAAMLIRDLNYILSQEEAR